MKPHGGGSPKGARADAINKKWGSLDGWEHACYIDYRNQRPKFVDVFLANLASWEFAAKNLS